MDKKFFDHVRQHLFGGKLTEAQVSGIQRLVTAANFYGMSDYRQVAYLLATVFLETDRRMQPIEEYASGAAYEGRKELGNTVKGDGVRFKGRGDVQITGRRNYTLFSKILGVDLVNNPALALEPTNSANIAVIGMMQGRFTGKKLSDYIVCGQEPDYKNARRIINGTDKATLIAGYANQFSTAFGR